MPPTPDYSAPVNTYWRLLGYLKPYIPKLLLSVFFMALLAATTGVFAYLVGPMIKFIFAGGAPMDMPLPSFVTAMLPLKMERDVILRHLPLFLVIITVIKGIAYAGQFYYMGDIGQRVIFDMRRDLEDALLKQSMSFYHRHKSGDLLARFLNDVKNVENAVTYAISSALRDSSQVLVLLVMLFYLDYKLALMAFVVIPFAAYPTYKFGKGLKKITMGAQVEQGDMGGLLNETIAGVQIVQAFGMEGYESKRFDDLNRRYLVVQLKSFLIRAVQSPVMELLGVLGLALTIWYGAHRIQSGDLKPEHFISFFATVMMMYMPIKNLGKMNQFYHAGVSGAERVFQIVDAPREVDDREGADDLKDFSGAIRFDGVRFSYGDREVLRGIDIEIEKGRTIALVGESGSGKSTLMSLLPRFYDVTSGRITIDGSGIRDVTLKSLRTQMALVTQDIFLFNDSVFNNISYGHTEADRQKVMAAAKAAYADDFIKAMPDDYDTLVGERGVKLSGGQKQRIAIARAILKDAPILLLDEATSALDSEGEAEVQKALDTLMKNRTTLVIAHRLSTIRNADEILVLKEGRVIERGRHDELLALEGEYAKLYRLQFRDKEVS